MPHLTNQRTLLACALLTLTTSACAPLWPKAAAPQLDTPAPASVPQAISAQWWTQFADPVLDQLVKEALENNFDLAKAAANIQEARANAGAAQALLSPRLDAGAKSTLSKRQFSSVIGSEDFERTTANNVGGLAASWEIDLWGRIAQMNDAAISRLAASEHTRNATALSVSSAVVDTYLQLRLLDAKLEITRNAARNLKEATSLEYRRWKAEAGTELAYRQSLAEQASTEARIPWIESSIASTELALQLLVGRSPRAMMTPVQRGQQLTLPDIPTDFDAALLLRRPDVASAMQLLAAAQADLNSIQAERYPRLNLSILAGLVGSTGKLVSGAPLFWDIGAGMTAPIYDAGLIQSKGDAAEARKEKAIAHYRYTLTLAYRDTYEALAQRETSDRQEKQATIEVDTRKASLALAEKSYDAGRSSKFEVLSESIKVLNAEIARNDARLNQFIARSRYFKALGGGY